MSAAAAQRSLSKPPERKAGGQALRDTSINEAEQRWKAVDKQSVDAVRAYLQQRPRGPFTADARQRLADLLEARRARAERDDRNAAENTKKEPLEGSPAGHSQGSHGPDAGELLLGLVNEHKLPQLTLPDETASGSEIAAASRDADAVLAALEKYSRAWNAKDIAAIIAIRPTLDRRTVKDELSTVRSVVMRIRPMSSPNIEGDRAVIECIHQVDEAFNDGIKKENPGARLTYGLVRRGGNWLIEDSH
jgi:hypothetical protein